MSVPKALAAIEQLLVARTGPMGKIIYHRELNALSKSAEALTPEDVDNLIIKIGKAITTILGQIKAQELQKELSTTAISILYGGKAATKGEAEVGTFQVVQAFFVLNDGRLLAHTSVEQDENMDKDIVSSMLTAVQGFIAESLGRGETGTLDELKYGNRTVLMERKEKLAMAVVVSGQQFASVRHYMKQAVDEVIDAYGPALESWDGEVANIKGIQYYTDVLCISGPVVLEEGPEIEVPEAAAQEPAEVAPPAPIVSKPKEKAKTGSVELLREFEFYGGFIRMKVAVKNNMPTVVTNVSLKLSYNETALRFDHLDPPLEVDGKEIAFGNVNSHEKKSLSVYLDPIICTDSSVDGVLTFRDAQGSLETIKMDPKLVSIVCPMLYTDSEINSAMLKRMIKDELTHSDTRYYKFESTDWTTALEILKGSLGQHDIKLVREIQWDKDPQTTEVWYYAQIKGRKDHLVVRLSVWRNKKVLLLFVASESLLIVTGFLAELRHDISKELQKRALSPMTFMPIFEHEATTILGRHQPLIMKVSDSEIDPDSSDEPLKR